MLTEKEHTSIRVKRARAVHLRDLIGKGTVVERATHIVAVRAWAASSGAHDAAVWGTDTWAATERGVVGEVRRAATSHVGWRSGLLLDGQATIECC